VSAAYRGKQSNDAKVDHALKATEAALKAVIWRTKKWDKWPPLRQKGAKYLYNHDFEPMLDNSGQRSRIRSSDELWASWRVLVNASLKQYRYSPTPPSDSETNSIVRSARDIDIGIVPWLLRHFRETK
jgi:hypothetical protein